MEEDTRNRNIKERLSAKRTIWALFSNWTRGYSMVNGTLSVYRLIAANENEYRIKNERPDGTNKSREGNAIL